MWGEKCLHARGGGVKHGEVIFPNFSCANFEGFPEMLRGNFVDDRVYYDSDSHKENIC